jgi:hypothetical protein
MDIYYSKKKMLVVIKDSRGNDVPKETLGEDFQGIIVTDG